MMNTYLLVLHLYFRIILLKKIVFQILLNQGNGDIIIALHIK